MNAFTKFALIWLAGYIVAFILSAVLVIGLYIRTAYRKPKFAQYVNENGIIEKLADSIDNYMLKPTLINRILSFVCWPVTFALVMAWVRKELIPVLEACPYGEVEKEDDPEMYITATWDFEDNNDKEA